ncbi:twin-arginine translocation signal domain-containing protein, partial [Serratia marcescens]
MSNKAGPNNGPHPQSQGAASPSRRRLLQGLGLGALALGGSRLA